jgi:hypothetical protein
MSKLQVQRFDQQPLSAKEAEIKLHADWRGWLILNGYTRQPSVVLPGHGQIKPLTLEIYRGTGDAGYVLYHPPIGSTEGTECLYIAIPNGIVLDNFIEIIKQMASGTMQVLARLGSQGY